MQAPPATEYSRSLDGGATWAPFNDGLTYLDVRTLAITRGPSPTVYAGTPGGVFKVVEDGNQVPFSQ